MIGYINGKVQAVLNSYLIVNCSGVGYRIEIKKDVIKKPGETVELFIYTHVRENELRLFGFDSEDELALFEMLLEVNGVGPKAALVIISILGVEDAIEAILTKDASALKVPGVGVKTAKKVILELSEKLAKKGYTTVKDKETKGKKKEMQDKLEQAAEALGTLGYSSKDIEKAVNEVELSRTVVSYTIEELIKYLLKQMR